MKQTNNPPLHSHAVRARGGAGKRRCGQEAVRARGGAAHSRSELSGCSRRTVRRQIQRGNAMQFADPNAQVRATLSCSRQHPSATCNIQQATWKTTVQRARHSCDRFRCTAALWRPLPQQCAREGACRRHCSRCRLHLPIPPTGPRRSSALCVGCSALSVAQATSHVVICACATVAAP
jgi:hypothetical protein